MPFAAYYRRIIEQLCERKGDISLKPQLYPSTTDALQAGEFMKKTFPNLERPLIILFATARTPKINWPDTYYMEFIQLLLAEFGANILVCGSAGDRPKLEALTKDCNAFVQIAPGKLSLLQLSYALSKSIFMFGPDSGPRHIANSVSTRVFYFPNLVESKIETGNYCPNEVNLLSNAGSFLSEEAAAKILAEFTPPKAISLIKSNLQF